MRVNTARLLVLLLLFTTAPQAASSFAGAPQGLVVEAPTYSDEALFKSAERHLRYHGLRPYSALRAEALSKKLLELYPESPLRPQAEQLLHAAQERLANDSLEIALFYFRRFERGVAPNARATIGRLTNLPSKYPHFSRMDEALLLLGKAHMAEEEPDEAGAAFKRLVREYPRSPFVKEACAGLSRLGYRWESACS